MFGGIEDHRGHDRQRPAAPALSPAQLAPVLADPGLVPAAVEESLRLEPAAAVVDRYATAGTRLGGADIRAGDQVTVSIAGANRDPAVFADPDVFDLRRANAGRHLAFAHGPHFCLGAHWPGWRPQVAVGTLLARLPRSGWIPATRARRAAWSSASRPPAGAVGYPLTRRYPRSAWPGPAGNGEAGPLPPPRRRRATAKATRGGPVPAAGTPPVAAATSSRTATPTAVPSCAAVLTMPDAPRRHAAHVSAQAGGATDDSPMPAPAAPRTAARPRRSGRPDQRSVGQCDQGQALGHHQRRLLAALRDSGQAGPGDDRQAERNQGGCGLKRTAVQRVLQVQGDQRHRGNWSVAVFRKLPAAPSRSLRCRAAGAAAAAPRARRSMTAKAAASTAQAARVRTAG
jgi:hypothetical protein